MISLTFVTPPAAVKLPMKRLQQKWKIRLQSRWCYKDRGTGQKGSSYQQKSRASKSIAEPQKSARGGSVRRDTRQSSKRRRLNEAASDMADFEKSALQGRTIILKEAAQFVDQCAL